MEAPMSKEELLSKLEELGICTHTVEHQELFTSVRDILEDPESIRIASCLKQKKVFTVEQALSVKELERGIFAKNLFLRDKKKSMWLYCAPHDVDVKLSDLAKQVGAPGGLRFADEDVLFKALGVRQGAVTVFGLINDRTHQVRLILDKKFWEGDGKSGDAGEVQTIGDADGSVKSQALLTEDKVMADNPETDGSTGAHCEDNGGTKLYFHPLVNSASTGITVNLFDVSP